MLKHNLLGDSFQIPILSPNRHPSVLFRSNTFDGSIISPSNSPFLKNTSFGGFGRLFRFGYRPVVKVFHFVYFDEPMLGNVRFTPPPSLTFFDAYFFLMALVVSLGSTISLLSKSFTLYILTSQCSVVYASSKCLNDMSLLPISALRVRS